MVPSRFGRSPVMGGSFVDVHRGVAEDAVAVFAVAEHAKRPAAEVFVERLPAHSIANHAEKIGAEAATRGRVAGRVEVIAASGRCDETEKCRDKAAPYAHEHRAFRHVSS